jgi:hypothetical protein
MIHVSCTMWRFKNQPSNSTSCRDNALRLLLVLVVGKSNWGLPMTSSFSSWGYITKDCFERGIFWRASKTSILEHRYTRDVIEHRHQEQNKQLKLTHTEDHMNIWRNSATHYPPNTLLPGHKIPYPASLPPAPIYESISTTKTQTPSPNDKIS